MGEPVKRCTCRFGRDVDGSEFGPCEWCENLPEEDAATPDTEQVGMEAEGRNEPKTESPNTTGKAPEAAREGGADHVGGSNDMVGGDCPDCGVPLLSMHKPDCPRVSPAPINQQPEDV